MKLTLTYHCIWHFSVTSYYHFMLGDTFYLSVHVSFHCRALLGIYSNATLSGDACGMHWVLCLCCDETWHGVRGMTRLGLWSECNGGREDGGESACARPN
jgi:hypothetical protein